MKTVVVFGTAPGPRVDKGDLNFRLPKTNIVIMPTTATPTNLSPAYSLGPESETLSSSQNSQKLHTHPMNGTPTANTKRLDSVVRIITTRIAAEIGSNQAKE